MGGSPGIGQGAEPIGFVLSMGIFRFHAMPTCQFARRAFPMADAGTHE